MRANRSRGEASVRVAGEELILRPSFGALVAAEEELGSLLGVIERASAGELKLSEVAVLFDHLSPGRPPTITREQIGEAVVASGLVNVTPALRSVLEQVLQGSAA